MNNDDDRDEVLSNYCAELSFLIDDLILDYIKHLLLNKSINVEESINIQAASLSASIAQLISYTCIIFKKDIPESVDDFILDLVRRVHGEKIAKK